MKCKIDGCNREAMYKADCVCQMHYFRFMRNGTYDLLPKPIRKYRRHNGKGYQLIFEPRHQLAMSDGYVYEHRFVIYSIYQNNLPNCKLCGCKLTWSSCHIDHIDNDITNNTPENLRPICRACNVMRSHTLIPKYTHKGHSKITFNGLTMTAAEWSRQDGVTVAGNTILRRIRDGWSIERALFETSSTHPNAAVKHTTTKYKNRFEVKSTGISLD